MNRAIYTLRDKNSNQIVDTIEFDLIDNPGCKAWQYAVMLNAKPRYFELSAPGAYNPVVPAIALQHYEELKATIAELDKTEFLFSGSVPESFESVSQSFLNQAHRYFTNSCRDLWNLRYPHLEKQTEINNLLQTLNELIHRLESYFPTSNKIKYSWIAPHEIRVLNHGQELGFDMFPYRQYHSYDPADLILDPYILGKTLLESFLCEDDPTSWDTSGHVRTNGGSCILLDSHRQQIYSSPEFDRWLAEHHTTKHLRFADFSLGYFIPGHKQKLMSLKNNLYKFSCTIEIKIS